MLRYLPKLYKGPDAVHNKVNRTGITNNKMNDRSVVGIRLLRRQYKDLKQQDKPKTNDLGVVIQSWEEAAQKTNLPAIKTIKTMNI